VRIGSAEELIKRGELALAEAALVAGLANQSGERGIFDAFSH
jgi:AraC-like DNA-binding protein